MLTGMNLGLLDSLLTDNIWKESQMGFKAHILLVMALGLLEGQKAMGKAGWPMSFAFPLLAIITWVAPF